MVGKAGALVIRFIGDTRDLSKSTATATRRLDKMKAASTVALAGIGAAAAKFGTDSVKAYAEAETAQAKLSDAYRKFPKLADVSIASLQNLNSTLAQKTKFDDDATASGQAVLAQFKLTGSQIQQLTPLLQDYAAKTGKDLPTAAGDLGKALMGQGRSLKAVGIDFEDSGSRAGNFDQIMSGLRKQVGGFAQNEGKTAAGQAAILSNQFGEVQETVGKSLMPILQGLATKLTAVASWVNNNTGAAAALAIGIGTVTTALAVAAHWTGIVTTVTRIAAAAQWVWNAAMSANPIGIVITAVAALVAALVWFFTKTKVGQKIIKAAWAGIKAAMKAVADWWTETAWPKLRGVFQAVGAVVKWLYENVVKRYFGLWKTIIGGVVGWITKTAFPGLKTGVRAVRDVFKNVVDGIGTTWAKLKELAAKPINFILGTVYNDGIAHWWNTIANAVGLTSLKLPAAKLVQFANGSEDHRAQIARGGAMRLWAEPETGGEAYIPLAKSKRGRSTAILADVAKRFGFSLSQFGGGGFWNDLGSGWSKAWRGAASIGGDVVDKVRQAGGAAWEFLQDPVGSVKKLGGAVVNRALSGLARGGVGDLFRGLPSKFVGGLADKVRQHFGGVGGPMGAASVRGVAAMSALVKRLDPTARITSGYRPGAMTATGVQSYHALGRAIDFVSPNMGRTFDLVRAAVGASAKELFYSGRAFLRNGVAGPMRNDHWDHIHLAMANGGVIPRMARGGVVKSRPGGTGVILGEGGYDEAVIPLGGPHAPRGQTIYVDLGDELINIIRKKVRVQGGNVQLVLGRGTG